MNILSSLYESWDLLAVGIVICITVVLGFVVYFGNTKSATHSSFLGFSIFVALWGTLNYLSYQPNEIDIAFSILRSTLFAVVWMVFFFFLFAQSFPKNKIGFPNLLLYILIIWTGIVSILTLTPFVLQSVHTVSPEGTIASANNGAALPIFALTTTIYILAGVILLIRKTFKADKDKKNRFLLITTGVLIMFISITISNLVMPVFFENPSYLPLAAVFTFPFIILTSYAVIRYNFLNIRIIGVEIFIALLLLINFIRLIQIRGFEEVLIQLASFLGLVIVSVLILRSVLKEAQQRQRLQKLSQDLAFANTELKRLDRAKSEFVSIASHQLRTPLTAMKGYLSLILEGSYGVLDQAFKKPIHNIYESNQRLTHLVNDLLSLSRIESGKIKIEPEQTNLQEVAKSVIDELTVKAEQKNLELIFEESKIPVTSVFVDKEKIRNVILNLIDNSIRYTKKGSITTSISSMGKIIRITIQDTGEGMSKEELGRLFKSFSRGEAGKELSTEGAGLGLYIAKQFVEMHKGKIWAESHGKGEGSTFHIELPVR